MAQRSTFALHDRHLSGELRQILSDHRESGDSFVTIARKLRERGIEVDPSTVYRWCRELSIETEVAS